MLIKQFLEKDPRVENAADRGEMKGNSYTNALLFAYGLLFNH